MEEYEEKLKIVNDQVEESIFDYAQLEKRNGELTEQVERVYKNSPPMFIIFFKVNI